MVVSVEILELFFVFLLFWIIYGQDFHEKVCRVGEFGHRSVDHLEILDRLLGISLVHDGSISHENKPIEVEESLRTW